jgi:hypothetical protein
MQQFFYDAQIRRFILQFIRALSNFQVEYGQDENGATALRRVPVKYGDVSKQASYILNNASENTITGNVPMISCYVSGLSYARDRVQEPNFISKMNIRQRAYDPDTGTYTQEQGNAYTVERHMPVPYKLTMKADIWTSNLTQKLQLLEQLLIMFNPSLELQSTDNYIDWTSLSAIEITEVNFSSRTVPIGTEDPLDIATLTFELPIWISAPAKVKRLGVIQKIVNSIWDAGGNIDEAIFNENLLLGTRQYYTPLLYGLICLDGELELVKYNEIVVDDSIQAVPTKLGTSDSWEALINVYGALQEGASQIRLGNEETGVSIVGTIAYDPNDNTKLIFDIDEDTIPANTLQPITAIIDPSRSGPGAGLPEVENGQRYLLLNPIGDPYDSSYDGADAWKNTSGNADLIANRFDIIEWNGLNWFVAFDSQSAEDAEFVTNLTTGIQYVWNGTAWLKSYEGEYKAGEWTLIL